MNQRGNTRGPEKNSIGPAAYKATKQPLPDELMAMLQETGTFFSGSTAQQKITDMHSLVDDWLTLHFLLEKADPGPYPEFNFELNRLHLANIIHTSHKLTEYITQMEELYRRLLITHPFLFT